jgi:two-component system, chemotaxis family, CheB/CheR fusion protein
MVLVIEDHDDTRNALVHLLSGLGARVLAAADGLDGLQQLTRGHPDVVFCDLMMPTMDGFEFARRIRQNLQYRDILLIAVTGQGQLADLHETWRLGFDAHLVKPVTAEQLAAVARRLAGSSDILDTA